jgi:hypothetical protein
MLQKRKNIQDSTTPETQDFINYIYANREVVEKCLKSVDIEYRANILTMIAKYLSHNEFVNITFKIDIFK